VVRSFRPDSPNWSSRLISAVCLVQKTTPKLAGDFQFSPIIGLTLIKRIDSGSQQFKADSVKSGDAEFT
jgi:hypothetical protein